MNMMRNNIAAQVEGLKDLIKHVNREHMTVVEVGSYAGESAGIFLESGKVDKIYCVDPWKPGYDPTDYASNEDNILASEKVFDEKFANDSRVVKVKTTTREAVARGLIPEHVDLVYIDACHQYRDVVEDIRSTCNRCDILSGHDWCFDSVRRAVNGIYGSPERTFKDNSWVVRNPGRRLCVTIPLYKNSLSALELESLDRCFKVLGEHNDIAFVCGDAFNETVIPEQYRKISRFERFDDKFFESIVGYSNLCANVGFYERFSAYTHILIYQLDGYVFRDDMFERWMQFDYVGAPWCLFCTECTISGITELVGNGGVCLRNVKKCMEVVRGIGTTIHPEDMRVFTARFNPKAASLRKPHCRQALEFSLETNPRRGYGVTGKIPSLCHKLDHYDHDLFVFFKEETRKAEEIRRLGA